MQAPPLPNNELYRLAVLKSLNLLQYRCSQYFDSITQITSYSLQSPMVMLNFVGSQKLWVTSAVGTSSQKEFYKKISFCGHTIHHGEIFVVQDTHRDPRFSDNPLVEGEPYIRFYAGIPIKTVEGLALGSLCILDSKPRKLSTSEKRILCDLGVMAEQELMRIYKKKFHAKKRARKILHKSLGSMDLSTDKFIDYTMQRIQEETCSSLSTAQEAGIERALTTSAPFRNHSIKVTGTIPLFFKKAYFVFIMGRDSRKQTREKEAKRRYMFNMLTLLAACYVLVAMCIPIVFIIIILVKNFLGFDFIPSADSRIGYDFWWF